MLFFLNLYNLMWTSTCFEFVCFWSKNKCQLSAAAKQKAHQKRFSLQRSFQSGIQNCSWELNCGAGKKKSRGERKDGRTEGRKKGRKEGAALRDANSSPDGEKVLELRWAEVAVIGRSRDRRTSLPSWSSWRSSSVFCLTGSLAVVFRWTVKLPAFCLWAVVMNFWRILTASRWRSSWFWLHWCHTT